MTANSGSDHLFNHAIPPDQMTEACARFFSEHDQLMQLLIFVSELASRSDKVREIAAAALAKYDQQQGEPTLAQQPNLQSASQTFRQHQQMLLEMTFCRNVDGFFVYVSELLAAIFQAKPETLKSAESVRLDLILSHTSMADLIATLAETKVSKLSYQGMRDLVRYLAERMGLMLFADPQEFSDAVRVTETRNLIVHNRGKINRTFLTRVDSSTQAIGESVDLSGDSVLTDIELLARAVVDLEKQATSTFGLVTPMSRSQYQWSLNK